MNSAPDDLEATHRPVLEACIAVNAEFLWTPHWIILIDIRRVESVLDYLDGGFCVFGFDAFNLEGTSVIPRLEYEESFSGGTSVGEAIAAIANWPRDSGLWVEIVGEPSALEPHT